MHLELLTKKEFQDEITPLFKQVSALAELLTNLKPKRTLWRKQILERLNVGTDWWDKNLHRLPVSQSESGRWYCEQDDLEKWIAEGNL